MREAGADEERAVEALGQRDRRCCATPASSRLWVRLLATVARIASPSAPPTCWEVLISPEARPASCGLVPVTAAIVTGTNDEPEPDGREQRRAEDVGGERAARSRAPARTRAGRRRSAAARDQRPA